MTKEELRKKIDGDIKGIFNAEDIINYQFDLFQKAYMKGLEAGFAANNESKDEARRLLARWIDNRPYTVSEQKDLIADTELFLSEAIND